MGDIREIKEQLVATMELCIGPFDDKEMLKQSAILAAQIIDAYIEAKFKEMMEAKEQERKKWCSISPYWDM